ncbi:MAG TPA: SGNH/GDSL hydrolase family protein [Syntrophorhabdaceae bacterium]
MKWRRWIQNSLLLLASLILAVLMMEGLLRAVPTWFTDYRSNIRYIPDKTVGFKLKPDQSVCAASTCFKICPVVTNSLGFRDKEPLHDRYDIAVLGDSYMEAAQVPEDLYAARLIERILNVNVLSRSVGGYGTINEFYAYKEYMAKYRPRVVLLFFCGNDSDDNSCATSASKGSLCADMTAQGRVVITPSNSRLMEFKEQMRMSCRTCYGAAKLWVTLKTAFIDRRSGNSNPVRPVTEKPVPGSVRSEGTLSGNWVITEYFLGKLNEEVKKNGGVLVVVPVAYPMGHLDEICRKNGISLLSIHEEFGRYAADFNLPEPYFGYRCDGHWNPLAHFLAANAVSKFLLEQNLVEGKDRSRTLALADANLRTDPMHILGEDGYSQIYRGGFYKGKSRIPEIMADENRILRRP